MDKWQISEFSKLTGASTRTLHYYDHIGILKPSKRQANGFRLYGKKDLQTLLQIFSLKFLRFDLVTIKGLLDGSISVSEEFFAQKKALNKEIDKLAMAHKILEEGTKIASSAPLNLVLTLIELYRIPHQLEKLGARKLLSKDLLKKSKEYKDRVYDINQQIGVISHDDLLKLCIELLEEIYQLVPNTMRHRKDVIFVENKIMGLIDNS